jgi:hypothetical protein
MTNPAAARIRKIDSPVNTPGCCAICGKSKHDEGFAYTDNFDFEFYGSVIFCADCVGDYARLFGYLSPKVARVQEDELSALKDEVNTLRQAIILMENTLDNLTNVRLLASTYHPSSDVDLNNAVDVDEAEYETATEADGLPEGPVSDSTSGGTGDQLPSDELSSKQGPDGVRNTTSADIDSLLAG